MSDRRGLLKFSLIMAGLAMSLFMARASLRIGVFHWDGMLLLIGSILAGVWTQHAAAEEIHDGVHLRVLSKPARNDLLSSLYSSLIGVSFVEFRREHLRHHRYFGTPQDPDFAKYAKAPGSLGDWVRYFGLYFCGIAAARRLLAAAANGGSAAGSHSLFGQHPAGTAAAQLALLGIGAVLVNPLWYILCWAGPLFTVTYGITQFRTLLEHWSPYSWVNGKTGERKIGGLFNLEGSVQRNLMAAQFGYNYHGAHHLLPAVPNTTLRRAVEKLDMNDYLNGATQIKTTTYAVRILEVFRGQVSE